MTTPDLDALTPKRRKVYDLATKGTPPPVIARRLKITRSAVYSHMRHLRLAGLLPASSAPSRVARRAASNGSVTVPELDQVRDMVAKIRHDIATRLKATTERKGELEQELTHLKAERTELMERDDRYKQAEKALAA